MNKINLSTLTVLMIVACFLGSPLEAAVYTVAPQPAAAVKAGGPGAVIAESFGNYGKEGLSKIRYEAGELTPGLVKEGALLLSGRGQFEGVECSGNNRFSKTPFKTCPPADVKVSALKTQEGIALADAGLKEKVEGQNKPETQRVRRVSRLQEPGEAMGGGREKHLKEDAEMLKAMGK
jgi:hypothetical protein